MIEQETEWRTVGFWLSEKKSKKFASNELFESCRKKKLNLIKIDLNSDLEKQGPFDLILHKLTAIYALAYGGNTEAIEMKQKVEDFSSKNPEIVIMDPLLSVEELLLRECTYNLLFDITKKEKFIFIPPFLKLELFQNVDRLLEESGITFPVVCKPLCAGGGREAHQMALVFKKEQLKNLPSACVVQSFINHNAVLYKIFIIGDKWFVTLRPSLKNFGDEDHPTIFFDSHEISKADCSSPLTQIDASRTKKLRANLHVLQRIAVMARLAFKSDLLGVDVVMDVLSGNYAVIDVNPFPSYDGFPDVMDHLSDAVRKRLKSVSPTSTLTLCTSPQVDQDYFLQDLQSFSQLQRVKRS